MWRQTFIVAVCAFIMLLVTWVLVRAWKTGEISSRGWTFQRDENPIGFWFVAFCDVLILAGSLSFALHTLGLTGDFPMSISIPG
jgi:hypothetical protein